MSTFDILISELTRDANRAQPKDALQYCANWFQTRLEEQRARARDALQQLASQHLVRDVPSELYVDSPFGSRATPPPVSPFSHPVPHRSSLRKASASPSPFGTLNVPGNALLLERASSGPPSVQFEIPPTSPLDRSHQSPFGEYSLSPNGDFLHAPSSMIFARRTSVSAESIAVDSTSNEPTVVYAKTPDQLRRIQSSIAGNFIFQNLDDEQKTGVLNAMQEKKASAGELVIRQGDVGDYFYVVESGLLHCFIHPEPLPATFANDDYASTVKQENMFTQPDHHPVWGKKVTEYGTGSSFGELALMYGHPRKATILAIEECTLWALDRITFRTIILTAAHRRRTMYEHFLSTVTLLSSLDAAERSKIADTLVSRVYNDGEAVVRQGEMGDTFFFIEEGEASVTKMVQEGDDGEYREIKVGHLRKGDYFGELSLLRLAPRAATVSAVHRDDVREPKLKVAALDAPAFTRLLGPLREIMERNAGEYRLGR